MDVDMHNEAEETKAGPTDPDTEMEQDTDELPPAERVKGEPEGAPFKQSCPYLAHCFKSSL